MNDKKITSVKQILLNPVVLFCMQYPDAGEDRKSRINQIWIQKQSINKIIREIQVQEKIISRKIGEAKKNGQTADDLIRSMQANSDKRKQVEVELENIEKQILEFFDISDSKPISNVKSKKTLKSRYSSAEVNDDEITIRLLENEESEWNNYVLNQPEASIHHLAQWRNVHGNTYGSDSYYLFAQNKNHKIVGVLPLIRLNSRLFGDMLVSMPYFQRGGAIADHPVIEEQLMKAAREEATRLGVDHIEYRDDIVREELPVQSHKVNMVLSLPDSEDALWDSFTAKLRAQIKRPQQLSPEVFIGGKEYLDDFYGVYSRNMRDLGSPAHSRLLIENMLHNFPENSWIIVIRLHNSPVSAGLLLGHGETMEIPLASTIRTVNPHSMNMLLYWEVLKHAIRQGYKHFDFGRSSKDAGTYRFKKQWGAQPKQLYWHYWLGGSNELPSLNASNPKYMLIINIWKRLPVALTRWLGPLIVRNIP